MCLVIFQRSGDGSVEPFKGVQDSLIVTSESDLGHSLVRVGLPVYCRTRTDLYPEQFSNDSQPLVRPGCVKNVVSNESEKEGEERE